MGALVATELLSGALRDITMPLSFSTWRGRVFAPALILLSIVVFFGSTQDIRAIISDVLVNRAVSTFERSQDIERASRSISLALLILPGNDRAHRAGVELGILRLSQLSQEAGSGESARATLQSALTATIQHGLAAVSIESRNYQNWLTLARLYGELAGVGIEGAEDQAKRAYGEAIKNNPTTPLPHLGLAQLELQRGRDAEAKVHLEAALSIKSDFAPAHFLLSQIDARTGDFASAREHATFVVQIAPEDPLGWYNLGTLLYA